jgi:hypothetical protein
MLDQQGKPTHQPFQEYIDLYLDLHGLIDAAVQDVSAQVEALSELWYDEPDSMTADEYLDAVQTQIRATLTRVIGSRVANSGLAGIDGAWLARLIHETITLAFAVDAEIGERAAAHEPRPDDDFDDAWRLRRALTLTTLYARRAAANDDPIARRITDEAESILCRTDRLK